MSEGYNPPFQEVIPVRVMIVDFMSSVNKETYSPIENKGLPLYFIFYLHLDLVSLNYSRILNGDQTSFDTQLSSYGRGIRKDKRVSCVSCFV